MHLLGQGGATARALAVAVLIGVTVAAVPIVAGAQETVSAPEWRSCRGGEAECARLTVPLDDTNPEDSRTIALALVRVPARDPDSRIGTLLVNPGGPGAPGADFAYDIAGSLPAALQDRFDIVGWDPRGTGRSGGVDCGYDLEGLYALDWDPDTESERAALEEANRAFVDACVRAEGEQLSFIASERTARDMDRIRAAVGDEQLTYLGFSYGTYLGALYARDFPGRVRALVLDGAVDPALDATALQVEQSVGFERSLELFLRDCARRSGCSFHGGERPGAAYDELRARVDAEGVPADDGRTLNETLFDIGVSQLLYDGEDSWSTLAEALAAAEAGDGSDLVLYADFYTGRRDDGTYDDGQDSFLAIGCADGPPVGGIERHRAIEARVAQVAPRLGPAIVNNSMPCAFWPVQAPEPRAISAPGAPPALVLGTRHDPATPVAWAEGLADDLESARLVTAEGAQHTAFLAGNTCVDRAVVRYLVSLLLPRDRTRC